MNYDWSLDHWFFIREVLNQIKGGIDRFNRDNDGIRAEYPSHVEIEYKGVKTTIPFIATQSRSIVGEPLTPDLQKD